MNILIKCTQNLTHYYVHAYETWKNAIKPFANVKCYGSGYPNFIGWDVSDRDVYDELGFTPDIELWCGGPGNPKPQYISNDFILKNPNKEIPKLILLCDYWDVARSCSLGSWINREKELADMGVVGYFSFYSQSYEWMKRIANTMFEKHFDFPYVYDDLFLEHEEKKWEINNQGNSDGGYPFRASVKNKLISSEFNIFSTPTTTHQYKLLDENTDPLEAVFHGGNPVANFSKLLNSCWITITDGYSLYSPDGAKLGMKKSDLFLAKYPQALASNSVLFCPEITSSHIPPLKDGVHYVKISPDDFMEKITYYLDNKSELEKISTAGTLWAKNNCDKDVVGQRIVKNIKEKIL